MEFKNVRTRVATTERGEPVGVAVTILVTPEQIETLDEPLRASALRVWDRRDMFTHERFPAEFINPDDER